jgi:hypothetical protein
MRFVTYILTALIVAALGMAAHNMVRDGHYWVFAALPIAALYLGWVVGNEADRDGYRNLGRRLTGWMRR